MASPRFSEQFKHKMTYVGKLGEFDFSTAKPIVPTVPEEKSHFQKAAVAIVHQSPWSSVDASAASSVVSSDKTDSVVFAKPIRLKKRSMDDCYSDYPEQVLNTPGSLKAESEPASHHNSRSTDLTPAALSPQYELPRPPGHKRKISMPLQDAKPRMLVDFIPYSLEDYRKIRVRKWVALGGLGPRSQENEDWKRGHFVQRRRVEYANEIREQRRTRSPGK